MDGIQQRPQFPEHGDTAIRLPGLQCPRLAQPGDLTPLGAVRPVELALLLLLRKPAQRILSLKGHLQAHQLSRVRCLPTAQPILHLLQQTLPGELGILRSLDHRLQTGLHRKYVGFKGLGHS